MPIGGILVPVLAVVSWYGYHDWIVAPIGEHAGRRYAYNLLLILSLPVLVGLYWIVSWLFDQWWKRRWTEIG